MYYVSISFWARAYVMEKTENPLHLHIWDGGGKKKIKVFQGIWSIVLSQSLLLRGVGRGRTGTYLFHVGAANHHLSCMCISVL